MNREEAIKQYIMPALKRTWNDDKCIEIISAIEQDPYEVVLDKIRAEIVHLHDWAFNREEILRIIDKYKADKDGEE